MESDGDRKGNSGDRDGGEDGRKVGDNEGTIYTIHACKTIISCF